MSGPAQSNKDTHLVKADVTIGGQSLSDVTIKEVVLGESLLTPGLQTAVTIQSYIYRNVKNIGSWKNTPISIGMQDRVGRRTMAVNQQIYRVDNRHFTTNNLAQTEELTIHGCDPTLLADARKIISKSWKCQTPTTIVNHALGQVGASSRIVAGSGPARDYIAESIHPFQVIQQQCNVALDGDDPSFLHYMTFNTGGGGGVHNFRSLRSLIGGAPVRTFVHSEVGATAGQGYNDVLNIAINFSFPCDFDYLSDLLNGIEIGGQNINSLKTFNMVSGVFDMVGGLAGGMGSGNIKQAMTNLGTASKQQQCESGVEKYLAKRQARMGLLEKDKIALRITVPWAPEIHVGNVIRLQWVDKYNRSVPVFGAGNYLVSSLIHNIQFGGYATTTMDCITNSLGA
jgi:hypothetical protein